VGRLGGKNEMVKKVWIRSKSIDEFLCVCSDYAFSLERGRIDFVVKDMRMRLLAHM
jgi:hypothetical protein